MVMEVYWIILLTTLAVCITMTIFCTIVPLEVWQLYPILNYAIKDNHIIFRENLLKDIENKPFSDVTRVLLSYSFNIFFYSGKEIVVLIVLFYYFPNIKGVFFNLMPNWVSDVSESIYHTISVDDSEPPELEVDPNAANIPEIEMVSRKTTTTHAKKTDSKAVDLAVGNSDFTREIDKTGGYVFDPTIGVIPREIRDLWNNTACLKNGGEKDDKSNHIGAEKIRDSHIQAIKKRNVDNDGINDETKDIADYNDNNNSNIDNGNCHDVASRKTNILTNSKKRCLPPVRFSAS